jgi:processive 1,2-diacylglycerol beta-glucosyltransferase
MKNILILSANRTGYGHASIARAIAEQLHLYDDVEVTVIDGFSLFGDLGVKASGLYGSVARHARPAWRFSYKATTWNPKPLVRTITPMIRERFIETLERDPPGLILSVHSFFTSAILNALENHDLKIPFAVMIADLVDIHPWWADKRADVIFCPGMDSLFACLALGMPRNTLRLCSFPVRKAFTDAARGAGEKEIYDGGRPLRCLLMSGGEGAGSIKDVATVLLRHFDSHVTILCGRNRRLQQTLSRSLKAYTGRVTLLGFCANVHDYMMEADIAFMRAGPNSMMEAIICGTPLILTGELPGQEERNPEFAQMKELGVACTDYRQLTPLLRGLLANNAEGLRHISKKQLAYRDLDAAADIAEELYRRTRSH